MTRLEPRAAAVLAALLARPGQVVARAELLDACWDASEGSDEALTQAIAQLRRVLSDDPRAPACIETLPKAGYRWIATPSAAQPPRRHAWPIAAGLAAGVVLGSAGVLVGGLAGPARGGDGPVTHTELHHGAPGQPLPQLPPLPPL